MEPVSLQLMYIIGLVVVAMWIAFRVEKVMSDKSNMAMMRRQEEEIARMEKLVQTMRGRLSECETETLEKNDTIIALNKVIFSYYQGGMILYQHLIDLGQKPGWSPGELKKDLEIPNGRGRRNKFIETVDNYFNESDFMNLVYTLGFDYNDLWGNTKRLKARAFLELCEQQHRFNELVALLAKERPNVDWSIYT